LREHHNHGPLSEAQCRASFTAPYRNNRPPPPTWRRGDIDPRYISSHSTITGGRAVQPMGVEESLIFRHCLYCLFSAVRDAQPIFFSVFQVANFFCNYFSHIQIGREGVDWMRLAQDRDQWWAVMNKEINLRVP
jgi:hypothetical protein